MKPLGPPRRNLESVPSLKSIHPTAAQWIGALIRIASPHPAMTKILDVIERLSERPYRTNFVLVGEPGTGKEGLGRALAHLTCPDGPLVRYDVAGFPEEEALDLLCGTARRAGIAEAADDGVIFIEELAGLGPQVQAALLRLVKSGRCERRGGGRGGSEFETDAEDAADSPRAKRFNVHVVAASDRDLMAEVREGRLRHDLYHRLARVVLWLPPLRERVEDIAASTIWMGNRILRAAGFPLEVLGADEYGRATEAERAHKLTFDHEALRALEKHPWPGNFRELESTLERALLLYRKGTTIGAREIAAALNAPGPTPS
ncbi:MAG TPA: sigma 54-interacting transcriptional regulator [Polyangia bacterium]|nr:sigma 54-interacting transcriptional regulator [Polyangia bacterium]